jgi:hypothetical protein
MMHKKRLLWTLGDGILILVVLAAALWFLPPASGRAEIGPQATCTASLVIPPSAFVSQGLDKDNYTIAWSGYIEGIAGKSDYLIAPALLPASVTVTGMYVDVIDNSTGRIEVTLYSADTMQEVSSTEMASIETTGSSSSMQHLSDESIVAPSTSSRYTNYVYLGLPNENTQLYAVRICYQ